MERIKKLTTKKVDFLFTQLLDEIAWVLNLRGSDISHNPLFKSYLLIDFLDAENTSSRKGILYVDSTKLNQEVSQYLKDIGIEVKGYKQIFEDLQSTQNSIGLIKNKYKQIIHTSIAESNQVIIDKESPITYLKSLKTPTEIQGFRDCHIRDASALISFFAYLDDELVNKNN